MRLSYCLCVYSLVVENARIVVAVVVEAVKERRKCVKRQSNKQNQRCSIKVLHIALMS